MLNEYRQAASNINTDLYLSIEGKRQEIFKLKSVYERKILKLAKALRKEDREALTNAQKESQKILTDALPDVDVQKRKLFEQKADVLQARALFSTNLKDAVEALRELVSIADEPALANEIKPKILEVSQRLIASANPNELIGLKNELGSLYNEVSNKALPEGAARAKGTLDAVESLDRTPIFSDLVKRSMMEITPLTSTYINNPDAYYEKHGGENNE
ncbi:hypothetical protein [Oceanobacillus kapialis]|uniref:Uncharacterized protein n=1 Tax=Oceanobacillus kapialis TaxID=481353 RepID=A0ABW5PXD1_9BACI